MNQKTIRKWETIKTILGVLSFLIVIALLVFAFFAFLLAARYIGNGVAGEGNIDVFFGEFKKITGLNGQTFMFLMSAVMIIVAASYTAKSIDKAQGEIKQARDQGKRTDSLPWATIKHFNPFSGLWGVNIIK